MTREEICNSMTLQDAIQVLKDTNAYGTMDIAKTVILEALEQHQHYKDLAESYEKTINKLTEAIAEQKPSELLILKSNLLLRQKDLKEWEENIKKGKEEGLIILPSYFEPILVPNDVEIRIEQEPQPKTESEGKQ